MLTIEINLNDFYIGKPVKFGDILGRIVEVSAEATYGTMQNGTGIPSLVNVYTPHGTILRNCGIARLNELSEADVGRLKLAENNRLKDNLSIYGGKWTYSHTTNDDNSS